MAKVLVTGAAGFIGMHTCRWLCEAGHDVVGLDNLNDYYEVSLKEARLVQLRAYSNFGFEQLDLANGPALMELFATQSFERVIHLAAQPGVRYSLENPLAYIQSNIVGFTHLLEAARYHPVEHFVFASSSSVYGANRKLPFAETDRVDHPVSLYGATKKSGEAIAHSYADLYGIPLTGLRFFTVYGPWGRPDMSPFIFARAIVNGEPLKVFNYGDMGRDFTYIDDIVEGVVRIADKPATADPDWDPENPMPQTSRAPYRLYNIGNNQPVPLTRFIEVMETAFGRTAEKEYLPMQPGDVLETFADVDDLNAAVGFRPKTPIEEGVARFADWFRGYYGV